PTPSPDAEPTPSGIPKKLWFKLGPAGLNDNTRKWTSSCIQSNPDYRVEFMTEASGDAFVIQTFSSTRPEIVATYLRLTVPILKADWLRYMLLYDQGGIWFDLDVECHVPIDEWIPSEHKNASVVVGLEFDVSPRFKEPFPRQFNSWTVMAKPRSPHLLQVIHDIQDSIATVTQQKNVKVQDLTKEMVGDVVLFTGPRRLKDGIYKSLGRVLNTTIQDSHIWKATRPKMLGDVLVMPGQSFAASMNNYAPELQQELPPKLVTHHYAGSWKNDKGGET
ncbi:glycosyltransferase family 32 protein, partial [Sporormia fimetaria CBS 119925]